MNKVRLYHRLSRNYLLAWCLLFLGFGVTAVVGWSLFQQAHKLDQIRFDRLVQQTTAALQERATPVCKTCDRKPHSVNSGV